jgi:hypothetical protein
MFNFSLPSKIKSLLVVLVLASSLGLLVKATRSEDFTVTCSNSGCSSPVIAIFNESGILPGQSFERTMAVENDRSKDIAVKLSAGKKSQTDDIFLDVLSVSIKNSDDSLISSSSLADFLNGTKLDLGNISVGTRKSLKIAINFDQNAGNPYKAKKAVFDIFFDISGDDITSTTNSDVCANLQGIQTSLPDGYHFDGARVNCLTWELGGPPAPSSVSSAVLGITNTIKRLGERILGVSVSGEPTVLPKATPTPEVQGISCQADYYRWWLPLVIEVIIFIFYFFWLNGNKSITRHWLIIPFIVAAISQIIHEILGCNCATGKWCPRYIFINLIILVVFIIVDHLRKRSKKS